jgi:hypothetical protein
LRSQTAQDIAAIQAPTGVEKNTTPALTQKQPIALLEAIPTGTLQGLAPKPSNCQQQRQALKQGRPTGQHAGAASSFLPACIT